MSHPAPSVLPVGTLHSLEWFWVSGRIFIYSQYICIFSKMQEVPIEYIIDIGLQHIPSTKWQKLLGRLPWITPTDIGLETSCGCQLMMVVGIMILYWTAMVVGSRSFNASHRRSIGLLLLWWWAVVVSMLLIEDQLYYSNERSTVLLEDQLYHWKINCCVRRSTVLLEDQLYFWKIILWWIVLEAQWYY